MNLVDAKAKPAQDAILEIVRNEDFQACPQTQFPFPCQVVHFMQSKTALWLAHKHMVLGWRVFESCANSVTESLIGARCCTEFESRMMGLRRTLNYPELHVSQACAAMVPTARRAQKREHRHPQRKITFCRRLPAHEQAPPQVTLRRRHFQLESEKRTR
jgi:hypothetical protein